MITWQTGQHEDLGLHGHIQWRAIHSEQLESILGQLESDDEVVIVDDASTDENRPRG